ncbi:MAG: GEVED domain-containing protein [Bacteroidetes bacterium]|nr:GEVED domain-containing protein [Bacteroidota bacterium]
MKKAIRFQRLPATILLIAFHLIFIAISTPLRSQCIAGSNTANLNWDNLDYLVTTGNYAGFVTAAMSQTQAFALGVNRVAINYPATITTAGENTVHTGEAGSFGTGADVQYTGNGNITITFDAEVNNFQFSLYDIDNQQRVNVTATDAALNPLLITMTKPAGGTVAITNSGTINAQGQAPAVAQANTSNLATVNLAIVGPVKTVTIAISGVAGDFWLSDFIACVTGTFPVNYFNASRPFTGQPTYVIGTSDTNTVSLINTSNGQAKMIFQDATSPRYINGLGYDHLQHNLYYVIDFTSNPAVNKTIKRYNFDTETMSVLVPNVNTLGIPTFNRGVESAGCAFYDYDLYFGVEGNLTPANNGGRETIIWRIEFDVPGGTAIKACQVYATPSDNGAGTSLHDWNDFTIADGLLVDFAGSPTVASRRFTHYDLQTQQIVNNYFTGGLTPRQAGITWNNTRYWVYDQIAVYNMNGTIGPLTTITGATVLDWTGFCGDATGFRPKSDFGDAPFSYDPDTLSPALHEKDTALHLGPVWDQEFIKTPSFNADADGADEDGIVTVSVLDTALTNYFANIRVYNNTGANATLCGWLDINGNGTFEPGEGRSMNIPNGGPVLQNVFLSWLNINTPLLSGQKTYLRIRLARAVSGMTVNNPTGYYNNGEVEDYQVFVYGLLPVDLLSFNATVVNDKQVKLDWSVDNEASTAWYEIQRSTNGTDWTPLQAVQARNRPGLQQYIYTDLSPLRTGSSYYRLRIINNNGLTEKYSSTRAVTLHGQQDNQITIMPNPVKDQLQLFFQSQDIGAATIRITDVKGSIMKQIPVVINRGANRIDIPVPAAWPSGTYFVQLDTGGQKIPVSFSLVR